MKPLQTLNKANKTYLVLAIFAALIVVFYGNTLWNGFVFDDAIHIPGNEYVRSLKYIHKVVTSCSFEFASGGCKGSTHPYYRPTAYLSYFLTYQVSSEPWFFHLVNLFYFFVAASLIFILAKMLTRDFLTAFVAGVLFIVHPINNVAVNWISAIPELMLVIFASLLSIFYIKYRQTGFFHQLLLVYLFYFLAILSKETAVVLPLLAVALDVIFFHKSFRRLMQPAEIRNYLLFAVPAILFFVMKFSVMGFGLGGQYAQWDFLQGIHARVTWFVHYIGKLFYPYPLSLSHSFAFEKSSDFVSFRFIISFLILVLFFAALLFFIRHGKKIFAFSFIWFAVFLISPLVFLVGEQDHLLSNRFAVSAGVGFSFAAASIFSYAFSYSKAARYLAVAALLFVIGASWLLVFPRNFDWKNEELMYVSTVRRDPEAHEFRRKLGELYYLKGDLETAKQEFEILIARAPDWKDVTMAYKGLGDYYRARGDTETALEYYETAARKSFQLPRDYVVYNDIGMLSMEKGNYLKGFAAFCHALSLYSENPAVDDNFNNAFGLIDSEYTQQGILYEKIGKEFEKSQDEKIVYQDKRCDEKSCQYAFSFRAPHMEVLPPFLITAATASGQEAEITSKGFNPETGIIILELDSANEDQTLVFVFPTCQGTYYETTAQAL